MQVSYRQEQAIPEMQECRKAPPESRQARGPGKGQWGGGVLPCSASLGALRGRPGPFYGPSGRSELRGGQSYLAFELVIFR